MVLSKMKCPMCGGKLKETMKSTEFNVRNGEKVKLPEGPAYSCLECGDTFFTPEASREMDKKILEILGEKE